MDRPITTLFMLTSVSSCELSGLGVLKLEACTVLERLRYEVIG